VSEKLIFKMLRRRERDAGKEEQVKRYITLMGQE
jgi:hypothetical protein